MKKTLYGCLAALGLLLVCVCAYTLHRQSGIRAKAAPPPASKDAVQSQKSVSQAAAEPPAPAVSVRTETPPPAPQPASSAAAPSSAPAREEADAPSSDSVPPPDAQQEESSAPPADSAPPESADGEESGVSAPPDTPPADSGTPPPAPESGKAAPEIIRDPVTGLLCAQPPGTRCAAVMVENMQGVSQRGLQQAGILFETVTENAITRLLAVYPDGASMPQVGPVCALRAPFLEAQLALGALGVHAGETQEAAALAEQYGAQPLMLDGQYRTDVLTLDEERSASVSIENCWFTDGALVAAQEVPAGDGTAPLWTFGEEAAFPQEDAAEIQVRFSGYANSGFVYDAQRGVYVKSQFGAPHIDESTGEALCFENLLILFGEAGYAEGGEGFYIRGGRALPLFWSKAAPDEPFLFTAQDGAPVSVLPGRTYAAMVGAEMRAYFRMGPAAE